MKNKIKMTIPIMKKVKIIITLLILKNRTSKTNSYHIILFSFLIQIVICPKSLDLTKKILTILVRRSSIMIKMVNKMKNALSNRHKCKYVKTITAKKTIT
jgi:hypothetical protein